MHVLRTPAMLLIASLCAAPAFANLVEKVFPGKSEEAVVTEFEASLSPLLATRLKDPMKPRAHIMDGKKEVFVELTAIEGEEGTWTELVPYAWYKEISEYAYTPYGKDYKIKTSDIPAKSVATWYDAKRRPATEIVGLACWLATKEQLWLANAKLATFAQSKKDFKADVDAWLCTKHGWTAPTEGLEAVATTDMATGDDGFLYMTAEAKAEYMKDLEDEADDAFDLLEEWQGGDLKSKPGARKKPPTMRLDMLVVRIERYKRAYASTEFIEKKNTKRDLAAMTEAVKGDMEYIEAAKFKAEREGIDGDWKTAAQSYDNLLRLDPANPDMITVTAEAYSKAAEITDGGRKAAEPSAAARAAGLYEQLIELYPKALAFHNHAGVNWLASGNKKKAKAHHEEVITRTDDRTDLTENEQKNREYAEGQLKLMK